MNELSSERPQFWCNNGEVNCNPPTRLISNNRSSRGMMWSNFRACVTAVYTARPPNSEACLGNWSGNPAGNFSAGSRHQGGAHVLMADGAVIFVTDSIEAGDQRAGVVRLGGNATNAFTAPGSASPYGLWGSLGSRSGKESLGQAGEDVGFGL